MELDDRKYAEYTLYPKIFLESYWGNFRLARGHEYRFETIIENRNRFINEYVIQKYYHLPKIRGRRRILQNAMICKDDRNDYDIRDHIEYYKCFDGRILTIFSMYISNEEEHNFILSKGYTLIEPIYAIDQRSYLKFV